MKKIKASNNEHHWPRNEVKAVEARERDLIIRITDWMDDEDEPAFDVEVYIGGVYDWNESKVFSLNQYSTKREAKEAAVKFAQEQVENLL